MRRTPLPNLRRPYYTGVNPRPFRATFRHIEGKGIGYPLGYSSFDLMFSPYLDDFFMLPVIDIRTHVFNDGKFAFNSGVVGRHHSGCTVYGMNLYYDYRNAQRARYNQVGAGFEVLGEQWDFRMNGYLPFGIKHSHLYAIKLEGLAVSARQEIALKGVDVELGVHNRCRDPWGFYAGVIPYCYGAKGVNAWGGKLRLLAQWTDYLALEVDGSYDSLFHGIVQGQISFYHPLRHKKTDRASRRLETADDRACPALRNHRRPASTHARLTDRVDLVGLRS